ncbi:MAG: plastocyanin [Flavobacteriales bacterium]|jgi:plastocyanin
MKHIYLLSTFFLAAFTMNAQTTHMVEVGGNPNGGATPYFDPQFITIELGDIVEWNNIEGFHGISTTSGPESFGAPNGTAPWMSTFTFEMEGVYEYECPVGNHALTQFGTITVVNSMNISSEAGVDVNWNMYPNPANTYTTVQIEGDGQTGQLSIYNLTGALVGTQPIQSGTTKIDINHLSNGIYIIELNLDGVLERRKFTVK